MKTKEHLSYWQLIFSQSKANGAPYRDEKLPVSNWDWPQNTYLQRRRLLHGLRGGVNSSERKHEAQV